MITILEGGHIASDAYQRYALCKEFGWDFYIYESQPAWFIEELMLVMYHVAQKERREVEASNQRIDRGAM